MGNARVWFDDLPPESIDSYDDLKKAFLENYLQQKKCIKDPIEINNIKQREGESTKDFVKRYKLESRDVKGAPEYMRISRREVAASNHERKKTFPPWKQHDGSQKQNFKKGGLRNQQRSERKHDRFSLLTKTPQRNFALDKVKFKAPPLMTTPVEKQNHAKFCEFHGEVGHNTDECMHLKKQIEVMLKAGKLLHLIKELKQNNRKEQPKVVKKGEMSKKDKALAILMGEDEGTEGPMIIKAEIGGHCVHRMYVDDGSASKILHEHCFSRLCPEIKKQLIRGTTPLIGFSGEIIWPIGKIQLLVKIRDEEHSTSAWMNFMVVRSSSPYNGIIGRQRVRKLQAVPSTTHGMLKIPHADMTSVPRNMTEHRLNVREGCSPVRQKKRGQAADRNQAIQEEVGKLVEAGIMKEVHYHDWLSNPVMVKKHDDSWRMCVNFKDLNKACPKEGYPLPKIDWKVESLCIFPFKCFLGAYKGYHQIQIAKKDKEKTAFITSQGIFCYTKMPFGLRNVGATYQRLVDNAFHKQIGQNLEVYVDDLVIKSRTEDEICTFGVEEGIFLGYKVNSKGLKVCPDKVDAMLSLPSPKCLKDVQKLNGKLASLNRFLAKSAEKSLPFFKTFKKCTKKSDFHWTTEAEEEFKQMKQLIAELPMLTAPMEKEELIVYLATAKETGIKRFRVSVKRQILADFIVERPEEDSSDTSMEEKEELPEPWILFTDKSSCTDGSGAGLILTNLEGMEFTYALRFRFDATKNKAEYEALIARLRIAEQMGVKNLQANMDSRLMANQVNGMYVAKEADMIRYLEKVKALTGGFKAFTIKQIPRSENKKADALSKIASTSFAHLNTWMTPIYKYLAEETLLADMKKARAIRRKSWRFAVINGILYKKSFLGPWLRTEAVIPAEIGMPTIRTTEVDLVQNIEALEINLDLLEERKEEATIQEAKSKAKMEKYYNAKVRNTSFKTRDLVYRNNDVSRAEDTGKLGPKWEGLYEVTEALGKGAYKLRDHDGNQLPRT
ncbi:reverse transcriptase domain-containing protein [Tanacetum coccineum]